MHTTFSSLVALMHSARFHAGGSMPCSLSKKLIRLALVNPPSFNWGASVSNPGGCAFLLVKHLVHIAPAHPAV